MILEKFITSEFDNQIIFINPNLTFGELKKYVYGQKLEFEKQNINNVVLLCENYIDFFINFFAAVFSDKKIHLVTDRTRLEQLDFEYILPQKAKAIEGLFLKAPPAKDIMINLFTSGSTGIPKNIGKTLYNLQAEAQSAINEFNLTNNKYTIVSTTSSAHSYGFTFNFIMPMLAGFAINSQRIEFPEQLNIKEEYILISTPSFLEKLAKYNFKFLNSQAKILLAGAKLKDETYGLISMICYNYWCETPEEKKEYLDLLNESEKEYQKHISEKYNLDKLFANKVSRHDEKTQLAIVKYDKEKWYKKILMFLKRLLHK